MNNEKLNPNMASAGQAYREQTLKEMLIRKADDLRAEAFRLEVLARELPEDCMTEGSERTLRHLVGNGIHR